MVVESNPIFLFMEINVLSFVYFGLDPVGPTTNFLFDFKENVDNFPVFVSESYLETSLKCLVDILGLEPP